MNIDFNKIWANGVKELKFPSDAELTQGLEFLGKLAPTTELHDVIFQRFDKKDYFLFTQIENACKRFSVDIKASDDGKYDSSLADAITSALKNQTKASELNTGIVRLANYKETSTGTSRDIAVNPANLKDVIDTRLKPYALSVNLQQLENSISVIGKSGVITDAKGNLPWARLDDVPLWLKTSSDDGKFVTIKAPDSTRFRLGQGGIEFYSGGGVATFRVNTEQGTIDVGSIDKSQVKNLSRVAHDNNYNSLNNLPSLGEASKRPIFDTSDVNAIPWDGWSIPTTSVTRTLKDYIDAVKSSISAIGRSNNINDAKGVLGKSNGGSGRADGNYDGQWFFTPAGTITNRGFVLGESLSNKITDGNDDEDPNHSGNVTIDTWNSLAIRSSLNSYQTSFKHCARSGLTYNRGDIALFGGGEKEVRNNNGALKLKGENNYIRIGYENLDIHTRGGEKVLNIDSLGNMNFSGGNQVLLKNLSNRIGLMANAGDTMWIEEGCKLFLRNNKDETRFSVIDGDVNVYKNLQVIGSSSFRQGVELFGATPFLDFHYNNTDSDFSARLIANAADRLTIQGSHVTIERDLSVGGRINGGGLGQGAYANFGGDGSAWSVAGNDNELVRSSQLVSLRNAHDDTVRHLSGMFDKSVFDNTNATGFDDLPWGNGSVVSTGHLRNVLGRVKWAENRQLFHTDNAWSFGGSEWEIPTTKTVASVRDWANGWFTSLKSAAHRDARDPGSYGGIDWSDDVATLSAVKRVKDELDNTRNSLQNAINDKISNIRWVTTYNGGFNGAPSRYANNPKEVIGGLQIHDTVNQWYYGAHDLIMVRKLQVMKNGTWYDVEGVYDTNVPSNFS